MLYFIHFNQPYGHPWFLLLKGRLRGVEKVIIHTQTDENNEQNKDVSESQTIFSLR